MKRTLIVAFVLVEACTNQTKRIEAPVLSVQASIGVWRSNLAGEQRDIGLNVVYEPRVKPVPADFLDYLTAKAVLVNAQGDVLTPNEISRSMSQDIGDLAQLEPAELVLDGSGATAGGWNQLKLKFGEPVVWDFLGERTSAAATFRLDSAPSVVGLAFEEAEFFVAFSEVVSQTPTNPFSVSISGVPVNCTISWSQPANGAHVRCPNSLSSTVSVSLASGALLANGSPVLDVTGAPFAVTVSPNELPLDILNRRRWTPTLPD